MQEIITQTDVETRTRLKLNDEEHINFDNERHNEAWWEELEAAVNGQNVPYYEDLLDVYHGTPDPEVEFSRKETRLSTLPMTVQRRKNTLTMRKMAVLGRMTFLC